MRKESSDKMAHLAAHVMRAGNPMDDNGLLDQIINNVCDAKATGTQDDARAAIREPLHQYFETAKSLAASVVSQGDGPE